MKTNLAQKKGVETNEIYARVEHVTPEMAKEILERTRIKNRKLSRIAVERYSSHLRNGQWRLNGETIKLSPAGELLDGQHRLTAIMLTGIPADALIAYNVPVEAQSSIDLGKRRTVADTLTIHHFSHAQLRGTISRLIIAYERYVLSFEEDQGKDAPRISLDSLLRAITPEDVLAFAQGHPEELDYAIVRAWKMYGVVGFLGPLGAITYLLHRLTPFRAERFCDLMETGRFQEGEDDAILTLRERLLRERMAKRRLEATDVLAICIKAANFWLHGLEASPPAISVRNGEPYPILSLDEQPLSKNARKLRRRKAKENGNGNGETKVENEEVI